MFVDFSHNNNDKSQKSSGIFCVEQKPWKSWKIWYSHFSFLTKTVSLIRVFIFFCSAGHYKRRKSSTKFHCGADDLPVRKVFWASIGKVAERFRL